MVSRRQFIAGTATASILSMLGLKLRAADIPLDETFAQLAYSPLSDVQVTPHGVSSHSGNHVEGTSPPPSDVVSQTADIIKATPVGPHPIDVAQSFVIRFYADQPALISQWPDPKPWNPLIVDFFSATDDHAVNDMVPWCAAFVNWCLVRTGGKGSGSPSSQSFLGASFTPTSVPRVGDLVVFTCYDLQGKDLGIGHVAFLRALPRGDTIPVVGGNQSLDGHSSIICERDYPVACRTSRLVDGQRIPCIMRLRAYVRIG
nr:CHAP domain-containing protein [Dyella sp. ASV24]